MTCFSRKVVSFAIIELKRIAVHYLVKPYLSIRPSVRPSIYSFTMPITLLNSRDTGMNLKLSLFTVLKELRVSYNRPLACADLTVSEKPKAL